MSMWDNTEYIIDQRILTVRNTYILKNRLGEQVGLIKQEFVSLGPHFWFEDNSGARQGDVDGKLATVHHEFQIKDKDGQLKGKVKKKIMKFFGSEWWMENSDGGEIARIKGNVVHHSYDMIAPDKTVLAKVHLGWISIGDEYCIEIEKKDLDPLLVLGFAVAVDHVEHSNRTQVGTGIKTGLKLFGR